MIKNSMETAFFIIGRHDDQQGWGYVTRHDGSTIQFSYVKDEPNLRPLAMKRPQADEIMTRLYLNGVADGFVQVLTMFDTCEKCGHKLGDDARCYNFDCGHSDPLGQYYE